MTKLKPKSKRLTVYVPVKIEKALRRAAKAFGRTLSKEVEIALSEHLGNYNKEGNDGGSNG